METSYLLKSPKNAEQLLKAIEDFKNNRNFKPVEICEETLFVLSNKELSDSIIKGLKTPLSECEVL